MATAEGTVYQRGDGRWVASLTHYDALGRKIRSSKYAKTKTEARVLLREMRTRAGESLAVADSTETFATFLDRWLEVTLPASSRRPSTQEFYASLLRNHVIPQLGSIRLRDLTPLRIEGLMLELQRGQGRPKPLAQNTRRGVYDALANALDTAVREQLIARNPARQIDRPVKARSQGQTFSPDQVKALIDAAEQHTDSRVRRYAPLVTLVAYTGVRIGEALALRWQDLDLKRGEMRIAATVVSSKREGLTRQEFPKTASGVRVVPILPAVARALSQQRVQQARERLIAGEAWADLDLVFSNQIGGLIDRRNADRPFHAIKTKAGVQHGMWHAFRHAAATTLIAAGVPMPVVSEILGHSSITVTIDLYFTGTTELMRDGMTTGFAAYAT